MKRFLTVMLTLAFSLSLFAQAQITTKKEKLSDFRLKTMKVVMSGNDFLDAALKEAVKNTWVLSPFELCTMSEFEALKGNADYYFMVAVKNQFKRETAPGLMFLTIVKGGTGKDLTSMVDAATMPICSADVPSGREGAFLPGIVNIMQSYIMKSQSGTFSGISAEGLGKAKGKKLVICEDDLAGSVDKAWAAKKAGDTAMIVDSDGADNAFMAGTENVLVTYSVCPTDPQKGSVCYDMVLDARTNELYYYEKQKVTPGKKPGFQKSEITRIVSAIR